MWDFVQKLQQYHGEEVFNPWSDYQEGLDIGPEAPLIRSGNLYRYLQLRQEAKYLFLAEGLGYQGGHFTGMAMTSERILLGEHPTISPEAVLGEGYKYQRTSNPSSPLLNKVQALKGFNEPTATVMWGELGYNHLSTFDSILWNIFPFHPYKGTNLLTNRAPKPQELEVGFRYLQDLLMLFPEIKIIAIGQKSATTLTHAGIECSQVAHPSMGGTNRFREGIRTLFQED